MRCLHRAFNQRKFITDHTSSFKRQLSDLHIIYCSSDGLLKVASKNTKLTNTFFKCIQWIKLRLEKLKYSVLIVYLPYLQQGIFIFLPALGVELGGIQCMHAEVYCSRVRLSCAQSSHRLQWQWKTVGGGLESNELIRWWNREKKWQGISKRRDAKPSDWTWDISQLNPESVRFLFFFETTKNKPCWT